MALLPLSGVVLCFSQKGTFLSPVCSLVLDVHVKQYNMCMWDSTTCASHAALHVHVKQNCAPGKGTLLSEKNKVQHRAKGAIPFRGYFRYRKDMPIIFVTNQFTTEDTEF